MPQDQESPAADAYEWGIRLLYGALILGNLLIVWDAWKDSPSGIEWRAKARARAGRLRDCPGCQRRKAWIRDRAHMLWQAEEIIEEARSAES
jgi:hypothetical protein